jgi:hypothetical protein
MDLKCRIKVNELNLFLIVRLQEDFLKEVQQLARKEVTLKFYFNIEFYNKKINNNLYSFSFLTFFNYYF